MEGWEERTSEEMGKQMVLWWMERDGKMASGAEWFFWWKVWQGAFEEGLHVGVEVAPTYMVAVCSWENMDTKFGL